MKALLFDVDGTLAETEEIHRQAFNATFAEFGLPWHWDEELNRELLLVSGGSERMNAFQQRRPAAERVSMARLREMHAAKKAHYTRLMDDVGLELRPGVADLLAAAREHGLRCAVVTASDPVSFEALARHCFGGQAEHFFEAVITGADVDRKKPDPQCYLMAMERMGVAADEALVFEDTPVGNAAALAAGLRVVITPSIYGPRGGDFGDSLVLPSLERQHWPRFGFPPK